MIFRAVFWIGLVSLLAPHEREFGLGRPGVDSVLSSSPAMGQPAANGLSRQAGDCGRACGGAVLSVFHLNADSALVHGLADVKAQIEQAQRERTAKVRTT